MDGIGQPTESSLINMLAGIGRIRSDQHHIIRLQRVLLLPNKKMDSFAILGLTSKASPAEIKRAYRRLAMHWHPDRNGHPDATERFKEVRSAYDLLLSGDLSEMSNNAEEAPTQPEESVQRAADIHLSFEVSLEEAAAGCLHSIHYDRNKNCSTCDGTGRAGLARTRFCQACFGSGRMHDAKHDLIICDACKGRGFFTEQTCSSCKGSGRETISTSLEIAVPPGMLPGDGLRLVGQGETGLDGILPGHLYLTLTIRPHPLFQLDGRNLHFSMPVSALAIIAGGEIDIPSLSGTLSHRLHEGQPEIRQLRLAGKGYPGRGRNPAGDLIIELRPIFPSRLNAKQRKLVQQANAALMENAEETLPEITTWKARNGWLASQE